MVGSGKRAERKFIIARGVNKSLTLLINRLNTFFPDGTISKSGLAKTATPYTTTKYFLYRPVMHYINKRNYEFVRVITGVHIGNNCLFNLLGRPVNGF